MSKKKWDYKLFREAFRQHKVFGLTIMVLLLLPAVFSPISEYLYQRNMDHPGTSELYELFSMNSGLFPIMFLAAPILILLCFRFLTQRKSSDFYHSLPQSRNCLFLSIYSAAVVWITLLIVIPVLTNVILVKVLCEYYIFDGSQLFLELVMIWTGSICMMSAMMLGMTLTGTMLSAVVVAGMLFCFPRFVLWIFNRTVSGALWIVPDVEVVPMFRIQYNIPLGFATGVFRITAGSVPDSWYAVAYTTVLSLILLTAAHRFFCRRKSENAEKPAISPKLQLVFRVMAGIVFSLIPLVNMFDFFHLGENCRANMYDIFQIGFQWVIVLVVYFLYELVLTKNWKSMWKAVKGLPLLLICDALILAAMLGAYSRELNYCPSPEEIRSVSIAMQDSDTYFRGTMYPDYFAKMCSEIPLESEEMKTLCSKSLAYSIDKMKGSSGALVSYEESEELIWQRITITTDRGSKDRNIAITQKQKQAMLKELSKNEAFAEIYYLPEEPSYVQAGESTDEESRVIYSLLREEIRYLSFEEWVGQAEYFDVNRNKLTNLTFVAPIDGKLYASVVPIGASTPKAANAWLEACLDEKSIEKIMEYLADSEEWEQGIVDMTLFDENGKMVQSRYWETNRYASSKEDGKYDPEMSTNPVPAEELKAFLEDNIHNPAKVGEKYVTMTFDLNMEDDYYYANITLGVKDLNKVEACFKK